MSQKETKSAKFYQTAALKLTEEPFSITSLLDSKKDEGLVLTAVGYKSTGKTATILSLLKQTYHYFDEVYVVSAEVGTEQDRYALVSATRKVNQMSETISERIIYNSRVRHLKILIVGNLTSPSLEVFYKNRIVIYRTRDLTELITLQRDYIYLMHGLYKDWPACYPDLFECGDGAMIKQVHDVADTLRKDRTVLVSQNLGQFISHYDPVQLTPVPLIPAVRRSIHANVSKWIGYLVMGEAKDAERERKRILVWDKRGTHCDGEVEAAMKVIESNITAKGMFNFVALNGLKTMLDIQS